MSNFEAEDFFKVYLTSHSFQSMRIPSAAVVCSNGFMPAIANLRNCNGQCWQVEVVKCDDNMYFKKGWRRFIDENSVKDEDILVFSYVGCSVFDVKVYGLNGCEKSVPHVALKGIVLFEEGEIGDEQDQEEEEDDDDNDFQTEGEDSEMELEEEEEEDDDDDDDDYKEGEDSVLELEEGEDSVLELEEEEEKDDDDYQVEEEDGDPELVEEEENEKSRDNLSKRRGQKTINKRNRGWHEEFAARNNEETTPMEVEDEELCPEKYVHLLNPYFVAKINPQRKNELYVPANVIKDYSLNLEHKEEITFLDPYNRKSFGEVVKWKDQRTCIKGWRRFCNRNKVDQQRDTCICEFLLGKEQEAEKGQKTKFMQVHIIRGRKHS